MAAMEVLRDIAIWGRPTLTRLVSMVARKAPRQAVMRSLFLLKAGMAVVRTLS
jgi:hypothetical protein